MDTGLALSLKTVSGQVGVKGVVSAFFDGSVTVVSFFFFFVLWSISSSPFILSSVGILSGYSYCYLLHDIAICNGEFFLMDFY